MIRKLLRRVFSGRSSPSAQPRVVARNKHGLSRDKISSSARRVTTGLQEKGFAAYVVGGAVRDLLLGLEPKDFDIATDATPEQLTDFEAYAAKMLVPDERVTTWIDIAGAPLHAKWEAIHEHVTQISDQSPFMLLGLDGWRDGWAREAYILRESRIETATPEADLFAGIGGVA